MHMRLFYVPVNTFSFMSEIFLLKCFAQGHNTVLVGVSN